MALTRKQRLLNRFREMKERYERSEAIFNNTTYEGNPAAVQQYRQRQIEKQLAEIVPFALRLYRMGLINL